MTRANAATGVAALILLLAVSTASAQKPSNEDCLACHGQADLAKDVNGKAVSLHVDPHKFSGSIHGSMFSCVDCHTDVTTSPHENTPAKVSCGTCHSDEQAAYDRSFHARAIKNGDQRAATCVDCHGSPHELLPASDPKSKVNHANIPATCGACHGQKFVMEPSGHNTQSFVSYQESVHGRAVLHGVEKAAVCTDCHGAHEILGAGDPKSPIFKFMVPQTCGRCHSEVAKQFNDSIHGTAIARGQWQAPVCTDCHGIHSILSHKDPNSPVSAQNLAQRTCARCHEGVRLSEEFGFAGNRVTTYLASYHGLASQRGSAVVANCASCHGVHNILPSSDPRSTINSANLVKTCGQCHVGVTANFVNARVHVNAPLSQDIGSRIVRWVRGVYLSLIFMVIGGMLAHNAIVWRHKALARRRAHAGPTVVRMSRAQRIQHTLLLISFGVLVVTGFALKYPESWISQVLLGMSEASRGVIHRIAGAVLIGGGLYHFLYAALTREGRQMVRHMWVRLEDASAVLRAMRYYLGLGGEKPAYGRFTYAEKIEYWALVWGTIVMAVTGVMLWAKVAVGNHLPRWWLDVATAVHFYEAVLATLAIVVWHFYQVIFDPDVYPMNWSWWDGKVPMEEYRAEHPLDAAAVSEGASEPPDRDGSGKQSARREETPPEKPDEPS
ncbi:MAG TPA: cytochrome c3 family protein [Terriglobales bacterium]